MPPIEPEHGDLLSGRVLEQFAAAVATGDGGRIAKVKEKFNGEGGKCDGDRVGVDEEAVPG